jgi:hypothetical protein
MSVGKAIFKSFNLKTAKMTKQVFIILISFCFLSCGHYDQNESIIENSEAKTETTKLDTEHIETALHFINDYVENCNKRKEAIDIVNWVNKNPQATERFKLTLTELMNKAYEEDPELGLGFDPLFIAQDYPDHGFDFENVCTFYCIL